MPPRTYLRSVLAAATASQSRFHLRAARTRACTALPIGAARAISIKREAGVTELLARRILAGEDNLLRDGANVGHDEARAHCKQACAR